MDSTKQSIIEELSKELAKGSFCDAKRATIICAAYDHYMKNHGLFDTKEFIEQAKSLDIDPDWQERAKQILIESGPIVPPQGIQDVLKQMDQPTNAMSDFTRDDIADIKHAKEVLQYEVEYSMTNGSLKHAYYPGTYITGGCIASLIQRFPVNDYDVYYPSKLAVEKGIESLEKSDWIKEIDDNYGNLQVGTTNSKKLITSNAITCKDKFQYITVICGSPEGVRKSFDFVHCMPWYDIDAEKLYISKTQYDAIVNRKLIINNRKGVTKYRESKFIDRGYTY